MWKAILKYGWDNFKHEVLLDRISKSEADYAEKYLIRWYKMHSNSYNVADGGEGSCGLIPWNKGKKTGVIPWNKGVPMSEEIRRRVSESKKGHKYGPQSPLHSLHKAEAHKIPIVAIDVEDPRLRMVFKSAKDAEDRWGWNRKSICACLKDKCISCFGMFWFYLDKVSVAAYFDKREAYERAKKHYKHDVCPDWINKDGVNIINCLKPKEEQKNEDKSI